MDADKIINSLCQGALDNRQTFSDAMIQHMREEIDRIKKEARKWHQEHKKGEP